MTVVPFEMQHYRRIRIQDAQVGIISVLSPQYVHALSAAGPSLAAEHEGQVLAIAGVAKDGIGGGVLWALVSEHAGAHFVRLDRAVRRFLDAVDLRRIEATTPVHFENGCRWLTLLNFEREGIARKFGHDGADHVRYARVQN